MVEFTPIPMPQVGANDQLVTLIEWLKATGDLVHQGELICVAETTKSTFELEATATGYLTVVTQTGGQVEIGQTVAVISPEPASLTAVEAWLTQRPAAAPGSPPARAWTLKAEALARRHGLDLETVARSVSDGQGRVTEAHVVAHLDRQAQAPVKQAGVGDLVDDPYAGGRLQRLLILGGGKGAVQVLDALAKVSVQRAVGILDDNPALRGRTVAGVPVLGGIDADRGLDMYRRGEIDAAVISISTSIPVRSRVFAAWKGRGIPFGNVIHPSAVVGMNVSWGEGNVVMALCHIGACATIGSNNFISAYCSVEHHCVLGDSCSFGPGVVTSSSVNIGDRARFGTGIFVEPGITIGSDAIVGSGCILWKDVPEGALLKSRLNYVERRRDPSRPFATG